MTPGELCSDCPDLLGELESQIRAIQSMDAMLGKGETIDAAGEVAADTAEPHAESANAGRAMTTESKYRVLRSHATCGLGEVLRAKDELLGREVALKVIRRPHDRDPQRRRRFVQEAEITSRLERPGVVPVHGIGQDSEVQSRTAGASSAQSVPRIWCVPGHCSVNLQRRDDLKIHLSRSFLSHVA